MMLKNVSKLLRACALAGLFVALTQGSASAATLVSFSTSGGFAGNGGASNITFTSSPGNSATFTFTGAAFANLGAPTNINIGDILLTTAGNGYEDGTASSAFTLTVNQTVPSVGSGFFSGTLSGNIAKINQSLFSLTFTTPSVTIGQVTYTLRNVIYDIVPPLSGSTGGAVGGDTTIQARIDAVPEPTTMMLLGTGLLAAFRARRRTA